jgi:hypothetical protein
MRTPIRLSFSLAIAIALAAPSAFAAGVTPNDASNVQREEAQTRFAHARELFAAKKFDEAHDEFEKSYAIVASPNALLFVARSDRERGKLVAAYAGFGRTAAEAKEHAADDPRYAKTAEAATEERDALAPQLGFVTIAVDRATPETSVTIGTLKLGKAEWGEAVPMMPGTNDVVIVTPGKANAHQMVTIAAGDRKTLALDAGPDVAQPAQPQTVAEAPKPHVQSPEEEAASRGRTRTLAYGAAAVGGVGIVTFAVFGLMSNATYNDLTTQCHGPCPTGYGASEVSKGKTQQTVADVGLAVGLVGVAAAVGLFVMSLPTKSDNVAIVAGPTWMGVKGEF